MFQYLNIIIVLTSHLTLKSYIGRKLKPASTISFPLEFPFKNHQKNFIMGYITDWGFITLQAVNYAICPVRRVV